ncbi:MAG: hypothetical protein K2R98_04660 [Gemmataceae bacterium]|nr:hypothetical protein [Gemmataceae bacterium]
MTEFLRKYEESRGHLSEREQDRQEWIDSVNRLMSEIAKWVKEADPLGKLEIQHTSHEIREERIGRYSAPGLSIHLDAREVKIEPLASSAIWRPTDQGPRARGAVKLTGIGGDYLLYRILDEANEHWWLVDHEKHTAQPLNRMTFEAAMVSLLT